MKKMMVVFLGIFALSGCAVKKDLIPMGGSKADGTVRMGYSVGQFEKPIVDFDKAAELAGRKCKTWGYDGAEPFGGQTNQCTQVDMYGGCVIANVSIEYQCTGGKASQN